MSSTTITPATSILPGDRIHYGDHVLEVLEIAISTDRRYVHVGIVDVDGLPSGFTLDARLDVRIAAPTSTDATEALARNAAEHAAALITGLVAIRRDYAAEHGLAVTDDEIAESVRASIVRLMTEEVAR